MKYGKEGFIFSVSQIMLQAALKLKHVFMCISVLCVYEKGLAKNRHTLNISWSNSIPASFYTSSICFAIIWKALPNFYVPLVKSLECI